MNDNQKIRSWKSKLKPWLPKERKKTYEEMCKECIDAHTMTRKMADSSLALLEENKRIIDAIVAATSLNELRADVLKILIEQREKRSRKETDSHD